MISFYSKAALVWADFGEGAIALVYLEGAIAIPITQGIEIYPALITHHLLKKKLILSIS